ncbi:hypothetical protein MRB53_037673 [Persea americana]|nr:hypothetical protein MRB53_037673 [Persea americana]
MAKRHRPMPIDTMPPFSTLADDEQRERKASFRPSGFFNLILTPPSFAHLPEYSDEPFDKASTSKSSSPRSSSAKQNLPKPPTTRKVAPNEQNWIFLDKFEDEQPTQALSQPPFNPINRALHPPPPTPVSAGFPPQHASYPTSFEHAFANPQRFFCPPSSYVPYTPLSMESFDSHAPEPQYAIVTNSIGFQESAMPRLSPRQVLRSNLPTTPGPFTPMGSGAYGMIQTTMPEAQPMHRRTSIPMSSDSDSYVEDIMGPPTYGTYYQQEYHPAEYHHPHGYQPSPFAHPDFRVPQYHAPYAAAERR